MPIDHDTLMRFVIPETEQTYTDRETMLYALGVGMGADPTDPRELRFVYEKDLQALPTLVTVLCWNDAWLYETGIDMTKQLHGEHRITLHRPVPTHGTVVARTRITDVFDKGPGRGAIVLFETVIRDKATGEPISTSVATSFARGDGGFGGPSGSGPAPHPIPDREPDKVMDLATRPDQALLYRLSGDRNPLHADPEYAIAGGFPRPILHGLCTVGHACAAVIRAFSDWDATIVRSIAVRFTAPVFPGETIRIEMWRDGDVVSFRSRVAERDVLVLNHGKVVIAP